MRRNSLTNMLGEFVGIHKTPDFRLSSSSNQELNDAVKDEKRSLKINEKQKPRQRYLSEGDIRVISSSVQELSNGREITVVSANPRGEETHESVVVPMRIKNIESSASNRRRDRPTSLIEMIRRKISYNKQGAIIESDEEKEDENTNTLPFSASFPRRRDSTRSERLFIPITPVETLPIRIVQVNN